MIKDIMIDYANAGKCEKVQVLKLICDQVKLKLNDELAKAL